MAYSGISIGYVENGEIILGATYDPYRKELYVAQKGQGVTRNGKPIKVSSKTNLDPETRICTSNSYERELGLTWKNMKNLVMSG